MTTRDGRGQVIQADDVVRGMAFPGRECRVVSTTDSEVVLLPTTWVPALPDEDGLIRVKRRLWDRMSLWERKAEVAE